MEYNEKVKKINPASASIIMALGIFLYAAIEAFPFLDRIMLQILTIIFAIIGGIVYKSLTRQILQKEFLVTLLNNPVNSFVMGTWIAGLAVLCEVITKYFPELITAMQGITVLNTCLYIFFIASCVYNFKQLLERPTDHSPHGVVLLSTVATQSLVILWVDMFSFLPDTVIILAMSLGLVFYILGVRLIIKRYTEHKWSITEDWTNSNCIIHGALSITGLALVSSEIMPPLFMLIFWLVVFGVLVGVEVLEITRAVKRVRRFGWRKGIFTYNVSQWSRNFTFGMFYAFTMMRHQDPYYLNSMYDFHAGFLTIWVWVVFFFLAGEIILWIGSKWQSLWTPSSI
ncbi:hypothetical protein [Halobacillus sp. Marseille-Q1614]|uniref:hypothetical protein n=1 Tax=Halobacillus sp. Marseille-Q1614 TaxID=2709134 RepID=UPI0015702C52|nr:hypothetical protein [Halobacillus sp. Marseille-Q1614]